MVSLASPIRVSVGRLHLERGDDIDNDDWNGSFSLRAGDGTELGRAAVLVRNGDCRGFRASSAPGFGPDGGIRLCEPFVISLPDGLTQLRAAYSGAASKGARRTAVETTLAALGLIPAGTVS